MSGHVLSPGAEQDLDEIWDFTKGRWGREQANRYVLQIRRAIETIAADPRHGDRYDDVNGGLMKYPAGSHVVFYKVVPAGIDIVPVLHGSMDFKRHLR
jgi:toxin ParE1/3/4